MDKSANLLKIDIQVLNNSVSRAENLSCLGCIGNTALPQLLQESGFPGISIQQEFVLHLNSKSVVQKLLAKEPADAKFFLEEGGCSFTVRINNWIMEYSNHYLPFCGSE